MTLVGVDVEDALQLPRSSLGVQQLLVPCADECSICGSHPLMSHAVTRGHCLGSSRAARCCPSAVAAWAAWDLCSDRVGARGCAKLLNYGQPPLGMVSSNCMLSKVGQITAQLEPTQPQQSLGYSAGLGPGTLASKRRHLASELHTC